MTPNYNRLIVQFNDDKVFDRVKVQSNLEVHRLYNMETREGFDIKSLTDIEKKMFNTVVISSALQTESIQDLYQSLQEDPAVDFVQYDQEYELFAKMPSQSTNKWWFTAIRYRRSMMAYQSVNPVKVAVIDSGIDHNHPDLNPASFASAVNRRDFTNLVWQNGVLTNPSGTAIPLNQLGYNDSHGTHVAGIIAALYNTTHTVGVANNAPLMNLRAYPHPSDSTLCAAMYYAIKRNARVINASWGTRVDPSNPAVGSALKTAIDYACSKGIVVVCAAGDNNVDVAEYVPAGFENVVSVGSVQKGIPAGTYVKAVDSNDGAHVISAPGVGISSLYAGQNNSMLVDSGTSMSTAFVTGLIARMLDQEPLLVTPVTSGPCNAAASILSYIHTNPLPGSIGRGIIDVEATLNNLPDLS